MITIQASHYRNCHQEIESVGTIKKLQVENKEKQKAWQVAQQ
jgi:hypothetical protein